MNDEKEKMGGGAGERGPAFLPSHHTPYTRLLSFLNLLAKEGIETRLLPIVLA